MRQSGDPLVGRSLGRDGQYRLVGVLGRGGMATVYRAEHVTAAWTIPRAVKVLDPSLTRGSDFVERFQREARTAAQLEHPNILPVFDFGETDGLLFLVMRLISDGTLRDWFAEERERPWELARVRWLADQILPALDLASAHGVVHRDIKPSNILITRDPPWAFLSDFGIAKLLTDESGLTGTGGMVGTPTYMAPEQVLGEPVDGRTDLYSFGIVLYELLAGRAPFVADTPLATALKHVQEPLPDLRSINRTLSPMLGTVLERALAQAPEDRFPTGEALRQALHGTAPGVAARPRARPGTRPTLPVWLILAAALVLVGVALGGAYVVLRPAPTEQPSALAPAPAPAPATEPLPSATAQVLAQPTLTPTPAPTPTPSGPTPTPQASPGAVVFQDDFSSPTTSRVPLASTDTSKVQFTIESGEYRVRTLDPATPNELVPLPGAYGDVSVAVDARLVGEVADRILVVGCRGNQNPGTTTGVSGGYYLFVLPSSPDAPGDGSVRLWRLDAALQALSEPVPLPMRSADQRNHLELRCVGTSISGAINGQPAVRVFDGTYTSGRALIGVGANNSAATTSDARFSNLVITQR